MLNVCICATAADRKGFARLLGKAIKRPSSTSDIRVPEADAEPAASQFPPTYNDPSFPPSFVRASKSGAVAHPVAAGANPVQSLAAVKSPFSDAKLENGKAAEADGVKQAEVPPLLT